MCGPQGDQGLQGPPGPFEYVDPPEDLYIKGEKVGGTSMSYIQSDYSFIMSNTVLLQFYCGSTANVPKLQTCSTADVTFVCPCSTVVQLNVVHGCAVVLGLLVLMLSSVCSSGSSRC